MAELASTASIRVVVETRVVSITTESTSTSAPDATPGFSPRLCRSQEREPIELPQSNKDPVALSGTTLVTLERRSEQQEVLVIQLESHCTHARAEDGSVT